MSFPSSYILWSYIRRDTATLYTRCLLSPPGKIYHALDKRVKESNKDNILQLPLHFIFGRKIFSNFKFDVSFNDFTLLIDPVTFLRIKCPILGHLDPQYQNTEKCTSRQCNITLRAQTPPSGHSVTNRNYHCPCNLHLSK